MHLCRVKGANGGMLLLYPAPGSALMWLTFCQAPVEGLDRSIGLHTLVTGHMTLGADGGVPCASLHDSMAPSKTCHTQCRGRVLMLRWGFEYHRSSR